MEEKKSEKNGKTIPNDLREYAIFLVLCYGFFAVISFYGAYTIAETGHFPYEMALVPFPLRTFLIGLYGSIAVFLGLYSVIIAYLELFKDT